MNENIGPARNRSDRFKKHTDQSIEDTRAGVISTGIDTLDRKLDGGFPAGTLIAITAPPESQSELLLTEFIDGRDVCYLATERRPGAVRWMLDRREVDQSEIEIVSLDEDAPLAAVEHHLDTLDDGTIVVLDPVWLLERQPLADYRALLNQLSEYVVAAETIAFLHCLTASHTAPERDLTLYLADAILEFGTDTGGDRIESTLCIPKYRGGGSFDEVIKLDLTGDVDVDVSRKIA